MQHRSFRKILLKTIILHSSGKADLSIIRRILSWTIIVSVLIVTIKIQIPGVKSIVPHTIGTGITKPGVIPTTVAEGVIRIPPISTTP
jgi:hypothetical protein